MRLAVMNKREKVFSRVFIVLGCLLILGGCVYNDEPMPKIVYDYTPSRVIQPRPALEAEIDKNIPRDWLPLLGVERKWTAVIMHHSGTRNGSAAVFDKWHREGNHWEGVGYDFVIGNGTNSGNGQVEVTFRWRNQVTGAHCGGTAGNWANKEAVGICLVGNFNHAVPTERQVQSLTRLLRFLQNRYKIPRSRIYGHRTTPGARRTECPGKNFSMAKLKSMLDF